MQTHGNLTTSSLWQPGELARRMLGERPSPVPPTRDLWPPPQEHLSISTLHLAYQHDVQVEDVFPGRASTLPSPPYAPTTIPIENHMRPRLCTVGTNTDPPPSLVTKIRRIFTHEEGEVSFPTSLQLTTLKGETIVESEVEKPSRTTFSGLKKAITGAKYRIAPNSETVESPKIIYDNPKPGDRMFSTFGKKESRKWFKLPSTTTCTRKFQSLRSLCSRRPPSPVHRQPQPLQITQV